MDESMYEILFSESNNPYLHAILIEDDQGQPIDFRILGANKSFEIMSGLDKDIILNQLGFKVLPDFMADSYKWLNLFQEVTHNGTGHKLKTRIAMNKIDYTIILVGDEANEFVMVFEDPMVNRAHNEDLEKMIHYSQEFLQYTGTEIDYQKIVDDFMRLCFGRFAVFNLFDEDGHNFKTKAISCDSKMLTLGTKIIGFSLKDKQWAYDPVYFNKINKTKITYFENLKDIVGDALPATVVKLISKTFNLGEVVVMKIMRFERILGEFTVFMEKGTQFHRDYIAELYTNHVGLLLTRHESDLALAKDKQFLETTLLSIGDGVISTDNQGKVLLINKAAQQLTGYQPEDAIGQHILEVFKIKDELSDMPLQKLVDQVLAKRMIIEKLDHVMLITRDDSITPIETIASPIIDHMNQLLGLVLVFRDITEKKLQQEQIGYLSFHDQLTGLYNRHFYEAELLRIDYDRNLPISLVLGDVNGLKLINDSFGHQIGDELLVNFTDVIRKNSRADDIIARLGGDEFIMILPKTDSDVTEGLIRRIKESAKSYHINGVPLSISFGYATKTDNSQELSDLFKQAEDNMYSHKLYEGAGIRSKTIDLIMSGLFEKNPREMNHSKRVSDICKKIASKLGFEEDDINQLGIAGLMHDIGKIGIEEAILNKRGRLNDEEWQKIKRHSEIGYRILSSVNEFSDIANFILEHHEKIDGTGYPKGLKGNEISIQGRIIGLSDAFDAMTSPRTYGDVLTVEEAISEIKKYAGKQFDIDISRVFIEQVLNKSW